MKFRLVTTDIDGTLVNDRQRTDSDDAVRVLRQLLDRGVPVVLVTGLNPWPLRRYIEQIGHGIRAISLNGIFLLEDGAIHEGLFVDPAVARAAVDIVVAQGYVPLVYGADGVSRYLPVDGGMDEVTKLIAERPYQPYQAVESVDALFAVRPAQVSVCDGDSAGGGLTTDPGSGFRRPRLRCACAGSPRLGRGQSPGGAQGCGAAGAGVAIGRRAG